jgi:flagellin-like protein
MVKDMFKGIKKRAVSEILSYVLLIAITVSVGISMYYWLVYFANPSPPPDCDEGSSIILTNLDKQPTRLTLEITNNGYFNVSGFILTVGENINREPVDNLLPNDGAGIAGIEYTYFNRPLAPGESINSSFAARYKGGRDADIMNIKIIQIQPFILYKGRIKIMCSQSVIKQNV